MSPSLPGVGGRLPLLPPDDIPCFPGCLPFTMVEGDGLSLQASFCSWPCLPLAFLPWDLFRRGNSHAQALPVPLQPLLVSFLWRAPISLPCPLNTQSLPETDIRLWQAYLHAPDSW